MPWLSRLRPSASVWLDWPHDPLFRPTVAFVAGRTLVGCVPTVRRPERRADGGRVWRATCAVPESTAPLTALCLETGEAVGEAREDEAAPGSIDAVIALGRAQAPAWDASGFPAFLALSVEDQVELLTRDVLGRGPDPAAGREYVAALREGRLTILDVRDDLLAGKHFQDRKIGPGDRVGQWICWGGLKRLPGSADLRAYLSGTAGGDASDVSGDGDRLARLALGPGAGDALTAQWTSDHVGLGVDDARRAARPPSAVAPRRTRLRYPGLLASLSPNKGVQWVEGRSPFFRIRAGQKGNALFGPYLSLRAAAYTVTFGLRGLGPDTARGWVGLEAACGDVILGQRFLRVPEAGQSAALAADFLVTPDDRPAMAAADFEFRLWTDGEGSLQVVDAALVEREGAASPTETDWLLRLSQPRGATLRDGVLHVPPTLRGHAFWGPYARLPAGAHRLVVHARVEAGGAAAQTVTTEAVMKDGTVLGQESFPAAPGDNAWTLGFVVPPDAAAKGPAGAIEVRCYTPGRLALQITRVVTVRTG